MISGVTLTAEKIITHEKGDISHALKKKSEGFRGFGEAYFSRVQKHVIKGWKRHNEVHLEPLVVPPGSILVAVHDGRPESDTYGQNQCGEAGVSRITTADSPWRLGLWVAFKGRAGAELDISTITEQEHRPEEADNVELTTRLNFPPEFLAGMSPIMTIMRLHPMIRVSQSCPSVSDRKMLRRD
jgi:dTDP-4-dehydrorhamnose 3,5-epimerase